MARVRTIVAAAALFAAYASAQTPPCSCDTSSLTVDYTSDAIPDATANSEVNISLDTDNWEVVFQVRNVQRITNGHVITHAVNTRETTSAAFTPYVESFDQNTLWTQPANCDLSTHDKPLNTNIVVTQDVAGGCYKQYEMRYSLIDTNKQDTDHCTLTDDLAGNIKVNCSIVLSSVRAYDGTEPTAFTAQEAAFAAEINLGTRLNNEVESLLHATLAKCSVKNGPLYVVDCRVPGNWVFEDTYTISQEPAGWIDAGSCERTNVNANDAATAATFIRCTLNSSAPVANVQTARANITAEKTKSAGQGSGSGTSDFLTFDVEYIIPRRVTTSASASLASFVTSIAMADGKYYYGTADKAVLEIGVVDSSRLTMTALELFNEDPDGVEKYNIFPGTSDARFQTNLNAVPQLFTIEFYPAAIREDSRFYRYGPHGINVSFTFAAARRQGSDSGNVLVEGLNVEGTEATSTSSSQGTATSSSTGTALMAGVAVGAAVLAVGLIGAAVVVVMRRRGAEQKEQL